MAGQIAAGEVVERPASVVKELCENALDAGARRIEVELDAGGTALVAVSDDGEGMAPGEVRLAFERHATSKLRSLGDLERLQTYGFRGEALPSVAAVAHVEVVTRRAGDEAGTRLEAGGDPEPAAAPPGTRVAVRDLFHNLPARRKSLRAVPTELGACAEVVTALALCRPDVAFRLRHGGRDVLRTHGSGAFEDAVLALWGHDAARALLPIRAVDGGFAVTGSVCQPSAGRANRGRQVFAVNGRPVQAPALRGALEAAFRGLLMVHRYPAAVVQIRCDPAAVDVNVHPRKLEVRFADDEPPRRLVFQAVQAALRRGRLLPDVGGRETETAWPFTGADRGGRSDARAAWDGPSRPAEPPWSRRGEGAGSVPDGGQPPLDPPAGLRPPRDPLEPGRLPFDLHEGASAYGAAGSGARWPELRPLGQVAGTYLVAAGPDGLYILDQHAAHERVFFEALAPAADGTGEGATPVQPLVVPQTLHLDPAERDLWRRWAGAVRALGCDVEDLDGGALLVRALPAGLAPRDVPDLLARLASDPTPGAETAGRRARRALAACRAAVKANQVLGTAEMSALLEALGACREPFTCPHGRPTALRLGVAELERHFRRV